MAIELEIIHNEKDNRFETHFDKSVAYVEYMKTESNVLSITSTFVPKELEGQGIAGAITKYALEYARDNNLLVEPVCPYTIAYFKKHTEYKDLLKLGDNK